MKLQAEKKVPNGGYVYMFLYYYDNLTLRNLQLKGKPHRL